MEYWFDQLFELVQQKPKEVYLIGFCNKRKTKMQSKQLRYEIKMKLISFYTQ